MRKLSKKKRSVQLVLWDIDKMLTDEINTLLAYLDTAGLAAIHTHSQLLAQANQTLPDSVVMLITRITELAHNHRTASNLSRADHQGLQERTPYLLSVKSVIVLRALDK